MNNKTNDGIKKNFLYQTIYEILILSLPLLTSPYIARVLGAEQLGIYSFSYSVTYYFQILCALGIKYHGSRTISAVKHNKEKLNEKFNELLFAHFLISIISLLLYTLYSLFFVKDNTIIAQIQILNVVSAMFDISWFYFGIEKFKITALSSSFIKIMTVICIFIFVKKTSDLYIYTIIMSVGMLLTQLIMWKYLSNYVTISKPNFKNSISHLKPLFILFIPVIALSMFHYMDKIMLGFFSTKIQTGLYENADKIITIPLTVIFSFSTVMLPRMSNLKSSNEVKKSEKYMEMSFKYMEWIALGMTFGLFCVADKFSFIFWGKEFVSCGNLIKILAFTLPFSTYSSIIRTQYLMPNHKDKAYTTIMVIGALINLIANLILIYNFDAIGVAVGTLISEIMVCLMQSIYTKNIINHTKYLKIIFPYICPGIIMTIIVVILNRITPSSIAMLIFEILVGIITYFLISLIFFYYEKDNLIINYMKKIFKKKAIN
ncbi:MAG: oligosaccharide flippase family protein [Bacilli bacterium]|nr:oligosaccharide flippase family protein [Bacilli bacterium]